MTCYLINNLNLVHKPLYNVKDSVSFIEQICAILQDSRSEMVIIDFHYIID